VDSGVNVTDDDPYHAVPDRDVLPDTDGPGGLPNTGSTVGPWMLVAAGAVILAGLLLLLVGRRRGKAKD
jgi:LPXTG-motif cell wall-anchored protein